MILYIKDPKNFTRKNIEKLNEVSYVAGHRINLHKSMAFLFTTNKHRALKNTALKNTALKKIKISRNKQSQGGKEPL